MAPGGRHLRRAGARQAGLEMVARANRWLISSAVLFAGALTALTAHAFHARAAAATRAQAGRVAPSHSSADRDSSAPLQPPAGAPAVSTPTPAPAPVSVSGGS
jgi:hypothetical protein